MTERFLTAAIALPLLIFIVLLGDLWFAAFIAVVAAAGAWEFCRMAAAWEQKPNMPVSVGLAVVVAVSYHLIPDPKYPENMEFTAILPAFLALLAAVVLTMMHRIRGRLGGTPATLSIALVIGGTLFHAPLLRDFDLFWGELDSGARWIIFLLAVSIVANSATYYTNGALRSRRLTRDRKWKAFVGGVLAAVICGVFLSSALDLHSPAPYAAIVSGILAISGQFGTMFVAKMKKMSGVEHTGRLLPGYGGILDAIGGLMWNVVILYHLVALTTGST